MLGVEPNNNNFKHSTEDQDLMWRKHQVDSSRYKTKYYIKKFQEKKDSDIHLINEYISEEIIMKQ